MRIYIIDANVILLAGTMIKDVPKDQMICFEKSILFLKELMNDQCYVLLDDEGCILEEYRLAYSINTFPNNASVFFEYALSHSIFHHLITIGENAYLNYPDSEVLRAFDPPDRKYIALSYSYNEDVPIVEAIDSKWWGIHKNLNDHGVELIFIDEEYIKSKYNQKITNKVGRRDPVDS